MTLAAAWPIALQLTHPELLTLWLRAEWLRLTGPALALRDIEETPVVWREGRAVRVKDVADVTFGGPVRRGDGSVRVKDGVAVHSGAKTAVLKRCS